MPPWMALRDGAPGACAAPSPQLSCGILLEPGCLARSCPPRARCWGTLTLQASRRPSGARCARCAGGRARKRSMTCLVRCSLRSPGARARPPGWHAPHRRGRALGGSAASQRPCGQRLGGGHRSPRKRSVRQSWARGVARPATWSRHQGRSARSPCCQRRRAGRRSEGRCFAEAVASQWTHVQQTRADAPPTRCERAIEGLGPPRRVFAGRASGRPRGPRDRPRGKPRAASRRAAAGPGAARRT